MLIWRSTSSNSIVLGCTLNSKTCGSIKIYIRLNFPGLGQALSPSTCESSEMSNTAFLDSVTSQPPALVGLARC